MLYEKFISSPLSFSPLLSSNSTKEKSVLNYHIQSEGISILFLISITLVSSSLYLLPLAYSQEFSYILSWGDSGIEEGKLSGA